MKLGNLVLGILFMALVSACGSDAKSETGTSPAKTEQDKVKLNVDVDKKEVGIETDKVEIDLKGEDK